MSKPSPRPAAQAADVDPLILAVRRAVGGRAAHELGALVVVLGEGAARAIVEDRARLAKRLATSDRTLAWLLANETPGTGEILALASVDGERELVRVRVDEGSEGT